MANDYTIDYPVFVVQRGSGYHCLAGENEDGSAVLGLSVFDSEDQARRYMAHGAIDGSIQCLARWTDFRQLLEKLKEPKPNIVFEPHYVEGELHIAFSATVGEVFDKLLPEVSFQWDYPVYVIHAGKHEGHDTWAGVEGTSEHGEDCHVLAVFSDDDLAQRYMESSDIEGELRSLNSPEAFRDFLRSSKSPTKALAFDLNNADKGSIGKWCMSIEKMLKKYLPE